MVRGRKSSIWSLTYTRLLFNSQWDYYNSLSLDRIQLGLELTMVLKGDSNDFQLCVLLLCSRKTVQLHLSARNKTCHTFQAMVIKSSSYVSDCHLHKRNSTCTRLLHVSMLPVTHTHPIAPAGAITSRTRKQTRYINELNVNVQLRIYIIQ